MNLLKQIKNEYIVYMRALINIIDKLTEKLPKKRIYKWICFVILAIASTVKTYDNDDYVVFFLLLVVSYVISSVLFGKRRSKKFMSEYLRDYLEHNPDVVMVDLFRRDKKSLNNFRYFMARILTDAHDHRFSIIRDEAKINEAKWIEKLYEEIYEKDLKLSEVLSSIEKRGF